MEIRAEATDGAGNTAVLPWKISVREDNQKPNIELIAPSEQVFQCGTEVEIEATATDNMDPAPEIAVRVGAVEIARDSKSIHCSWNAETPGTYEIKIIAQDRAGNIQELPWTIYVQDLRAPELFISSPWDGESINVGEPVWINAWVTNDVSVASLTVLVNGGYLTGVSGDTIEYDWYPECEGIYTITVQAESIAGVKHSECVTVYVEDLRLPEVEILAPGDGDWVYVGDPVTISAEVTNGVPIDSLAVYVDGS